MRILFLIISLLIAPQVRAEQMPGEEIPTIQSIGSHKRAVPKKRTPTKKVVVPPAKPIYNHMAILREAALAEHLQDVKAKNKVEHSDLVIGALLLKAEAFLRQGDSTSAVLTVEKAALFSEESPLPHFFLSHLYRVNNKESLFRAIGEYATAIRLSINHFWFFTSAIGMTSFAFMITFLFCLVTFLLYSVLHYLPLWAHYYRERLPQGITNRPILLILTVLLFLLFFVLPPFWFLSILLFFFWFFYQRQERWLAIAFWVGLLLISFLIKPTLTLLTAKGAGTLHQMADNQSGVFLISSPDVTRSDSADAAGTDWKTDFILASYQLQEHDLKGAEESYQQALLKNPDEKGILNNLGNIAFYQNKLPDAVHYYQKAIEKDPNYVAAHYNLGQVQNEMFAFDKGAAKYLEAKKINQSLAEEYAQWASDYPNHPVIEYRFSEWDLWKELFFMIIGETDPLANRIDALWGGERTAITFFFLVILIGGGMTYIVVRFEKNFSESFCPTCKKPICLRCQESFSNYNLCAQCGTDMITGSSKKIGEIPKRLSPFLILPGGSHLILQRPIVALGFLIPFYFSITLMTVGDLFLTSTHWHLSIAESPLLPMTILFLYGAYLLDLYLRRGK
ncbi:MAG: tetratricopeptide repeat protein [Nitrospirota bacterium]